MKAQYTKDELREAIREVTADKTPSKEIIMIERAMRMYPKDANRPMDF